MSKKIVYTIAPMPHSYNKIYEAVVQTPQGQKRFITSRTRIQNTLADIEQMLDNTNTTQQKEKQ